MTIIFNSQCINVIGKTLNYTIQQVNEHQS